MKSKKNIKSILLMAILGIISLFFINMSLAANTAKVSVETANLRETADENSRILEQFSINQEVEIIEKQGDWYKVKAKGMTGYLRQDLVKVEETKNDTQSNQIKENQTNQEAINQTTSNENQNVENTNKEENNQANNTKEIELGKQKVKEDTKLKIVPLINATDIIEVKKEEEVIVIELINDWACIEAKNTKGWIRTEKLQSKEEPVAQPTNTETPVTTQAQTTNTAPTNTTATNTTATTKTLYTNTQTVNLRKDASTSSKILVTLSINTSVEVISEKNGWSKVKVSGKEGYISSSLLSAKKQETSRSMTTTRKEATNNTTTTASNEKATTAKQSASAPVSSSGKGSAVVAEANKYIGCKYRYGGTTPSGFDCSGFTQYIYKKFGVSLNRTAAAQYSNGVAVSRSQLQPGDLVMFGKSGISHVAIYAGGGRIVHAATTATGVRTDSLNSGYYSKNYVGARRIFQ